ncbi:MAG: S8 family serine peptidase, partial [Candidatus Mariimomonas ferrooxydans]
PSQDIPFPEAIYFVTVEKFKEIFSVNLIYPNNKSEVDYSPLTFRWGGKDRPITYIIEFLEEGGEKPIFSAYTRNADYKLPPTVLKGIFAPGKSYLWRVKGFDTDNNITGDSQVFRFTFKELTSYLPGQIVLATRIESIQTEGSQKGIELIEEIGHKYDLRLIDKFDVKSLNLKVAVFHTEEDILKLINTIGKEDGVILVQPNYIFRTMSEPMSHMQNIDRILNFQKLHKQYTGKGVLVAIIDTGVDIEHRDLKDRISASENLMKDYAYKAEVHGTAVAGVIGASINEFGINGVAPEAEILALRACSQVSETRPEGECHSTSITKAIDIAIEGKARIVNMSFGSSTPDKLFIKLIEEGSRRGIIFVAPVGNMPLQKDLTFPASHPDVIAIGGLDDSGNPYPNPEIAPYLHTTSTITHTPRLHTTSTITHA